MRSTRLASFGLPDPPSPLRAAEAALAALPTRDATRLVMRMDTGWSQDPGIAKLLAATLHKVTGGAANTDFALVATALWCAADVADDLMDGDVPQALAASAHLDAIRLQALAAGVAARLPEGSARVQSLLFTMCQGQALDLEGRESVHPVDVDRIVAGKAGAEVGGLCGLAACAAGVPPDPWARAGTHLGALLQRVSDIHDLLGSGPSKDWRAAHPASALRDALHTDAHGWLRRGLAGDRGRTEAFARSFVRASAAAREASLSAVRSQLAGLVEAASQAEPVGALDGLVAAGELAAELAETLWPASAPVPTPRTERAADRLAELSRFVADHAIGGDAEEVHRWGLFGQDHLVGDLFSALVLCIAAGPALPADQLSPLREHAWSRRTLRDGQATWRFYPGFLEIPEDADDVGLALQVFGDAIDDRTISRLLAGFQPQGWVSTWLGPETTLTWNPSPCPVVTSNAWAGLDRIGAHPPDPGATLASLHAWARAPGDTAHYPRGVAIAWVLLNLCGLRTPPDGVSEVRKLLAHHLVRPWHLGARLGSRLETALAARALAAHGAPLDPQLLAESLLRDPSIDGGLPADPFYRTLVRGYRGVPSHEAAWFRSRTLTSAWVLGSCPPGADLLVGLQSPDPIGSSLPGTP